MVDESADLALLATRAGGPALEKFNPFWSHRIKVAEFIGGGSTARFFCNL
jgi:hypothetical protein